MYVFSVDHLELDNKLETLSLGKTDSLPLLSIRSFPIVLYLRVQLCEILPIHVDMLHRFFLYCSIITMNIGRALYLTVNNEGSTAQCEIQNKHTNMPWLMMSEPMPPFRNLMNKLLYTTRERFEKLL